MAVDAETFGLTLGELAIHRERAEAELSGLSRG